MPHCPHHRITVSGPECPVCRAEQVKLNDEQCAICKEKESPILTMMCAPCISSHKRIHFEKDDDKEVEYVTRHTTLVQATF